MKIYRYCTGNWKINICFNDNVKIWKCNKMKGFKNTGNTTEPQTTNLLQRDNTHWCPCWGSLSPPLSSPPGLGYWRHCQHSTPCGSSQTVLQVWVCVRERKVTCFVYMYGSERDEIYTLTPPNYAHDILRLTVKLWRKKCLHISP